MIAKISGGKDTAGLIRYLFDTKKAKDHTDPHLVASWDGFAPDPGRADDFDTTKRLLVADLDLHVKQARRLGRAPDKHTWHCSIRAAESDRHLSDEEWADIARRVVAATGIAPDGDPDGCRWVAVRHAPDHIHIAATKVRADLRTARHWNDYLTADRELATIEKEYGLYKVVRGDRTAAKRPTRAEQEKARRQGRKTTSREQLRTTVRQLVSITASPEEFLRLLDGVDGVRVDVQHFPSGDIRGYKVGHQRRRRAGLVLRLPSRPRPVLPQNPRAPHRHRTPTRNRAGQPTQDEPLAPGHRGGRTHPPPPRPERRHRRPGTRRGLRRGPRRPAAPRPRPPVPAAPAGCLRVRTCLPLPHSGPAGPGPRPARRRTRATHDTGRR